MRYNKHQNKKSTLLRTLLRVEKGDTGNAFVGFGFYCFDSKTKPKPSPVVQHLLYCLKPCCCDAETYAFSLLVFFPDWTGCSFLQGLGKLAGSCHVAEVPSFFMGVYKMNHLWLFPLCSHVQHLSKQIVTSKAHTATVLTEVVAWIYHGSSKSSPFFLFEILITLSESTSGGKVFV